MGALKRWLFFSVGAKVLDIITTLYLVRRDGPKVESHPFTADMIYAYGTVPGLLLNGAIVSMLFWVLYKYQRKDLLVISTALMMAIVLVNLVNIVMFHIIL